MIFTETVVNVPDHDCDIVLILASGKKLTVQCRPSNGDGDYKGSLDIILPDNTCVTSWQGDDMQPAPAIRKGRQHERNAKQLAIELP